MDSLNKVTLFCGKAPRPVNFVHVKVGDGKPVTWHRGSLMFCPVLAWMGPGDSLTRGGARTKHTASNASQYLSKSVLYIMLLEQDLWYANQVSGCKRNIFYNCRLRGRVRGSLTQKKFSCLVHSVLYYPGFTSIYNSESFCKRSKFSACTYISQGPN